MKRCGVDKRIVCLNLLLKGRVATTPSEVIPGLHLISKSKEMESEDDDTLQAPDRYIVIKHFRDWEKV